jgi:hypothetical protein
MPSLVRVPSKSLSSSSSTSRQSACLVCRHPMSSHPNLKLWPVSQVDVSIQASFSHDGSKFYLSFQPIPPPSPMHLTSIPPTPCLSHFFLSYLLRNTFFASSTFNIRKLGPISSGWGWNENVFFLFREISVQWNISFSQKFPLSSKYFHFAKIIT